MRKKRQRKFKKHRRMQLAMLGDYEDDSSSGSSSSGELTPTHKLNYDQSNTSGTTSTSATNAAANAPNPSILSSLRSVLIVLSTALICFAAARNSITWHCQRFWGASGDFWQAQWDKFLNLVGEDPFSLWVYYTTILSFCVYWLFGGIYTLLDITNKPAALRRYKIQPGTNEPVDTSRLLKVIWQVLFNQLVVGVPSSLFMYILIKWRGFPPIRELPTFHWVLYELAVHILVEEAGFYYSHRFLHSRALYKYIHKQHHEWTAPIAVTAIYCHPIEHLFSNLLPPFLGVFIMGSHVATAWLWFTLAILSTLNAHSGYHLPFFPSPEAHDFHHLKFNNCFGVLGVLDRLHGTDSNFRQTRAYMRHIMMLSFIPPREAFPEEPNTCKLKYKLGKS